MGRILDAILRQTEFDQGYASTQFGEGSTALAPDGRMLVGGDGSQLIISANEKSVGIVISVPAATDKVVFLSFGQAALIDSGIALIPGGQRLVFLSALSRLDLFAMTTAAGARIAWQQFEG